MNRSQRSGVTFRIGRDRGALGTEYISETAASRTCGEHVRNGSGLLASRMTDPDQRSSSRVLTPTLAVLAGSSISTVSDSCCTQEISGGI
jgi:hypothetical protein